MINAIPANWDYNESLENLFLFYQASEEMLSYCSPESFRVTVHNTITLCLELGHVFSVLKKAGQLKEYYQKYTCPIIEELISSIRADLIIKQRLGKRCDTVITGLEEAKNNSAVLLRWVNLILQSCTLEQYTVLCKDRIIDYVVNNSKERKELLFVANSYYVSLINSGYNPEYIYRYIVRFFSGKNNRITESKQVISFLDNFNFQNSEYEFYIVADMFQPDDFTKIVPELNSITETTFFNQIFVC